MSDEKNQSAIDVPIPTTGRTDSDIESSVDEIEDNRGFNFFHRFLDGWINSAMAISTLSIICIILALCNMYQLTIMATKFNNEKVVLVPSGMQSEIRVRTGEMSPEYIRQMGLIIATLYVSFNPKTIVSNIEAILDYSTPLFYAKNALKMRKDAKIASHAELAQTFMVRDVLHKGRTVFIRGSIRRYSYGKMIELRPNAIVIAKLGYNASLRKAGIEKLSLYNDYNTWIKQSAEKKVQK